MWNYARLSKFAKENGGPEKLMEKLVSDGIKTGRTQMLPFLGLALVTGIAGTVAYSKVKDYFADKNTKSEIQDVKDELIEGINEYDNEHTDSPESSEISPTT